jgi:hypothetical protein
MVHQNRACIRSRAFTRFAPKPSPFQLHHRHCEVFELSFLISTTRALWQIVLHLHTIAEDHALRDDVTQADFPRIADELQVLSDTTTVGSTISQTKLHPLCCLTIRESLARGIIILLSLCSRFTWIFRRARSWMS